MEKLLNVTSKQYDKAKSLSWFHAFVAPILIIVSIWIFIGSYEGVIGGLIYTLVLTALNVARLIISNEPFEHEKSYMYFEALKCLFILIGIFGLGLVATIYGVYHA